MSNRVRASQSKVKLWRKCRRAWWYRYIEKLRRKRKARPLQFGTMVHEMIEEYANGNDPMKHLEKIAKRDDKMFRSQAEEWGNLVEDTRIIMAEYFDYWEGHKDEVEYIKLKGKSSEHTFEVEVTDGIFAEGKIDNIARSKNKLRWLTEHKSGRAVLPEDHRWRSIQSALYIRIVDMLGLPALDGTLWDYIRSKPPTRPQVLKDGALSARGLDTLPGTVFAALKENGIKLSDPKYRVLIKQAEDNRRTYFQRFFTPTKKRVVDVLFNEFVRSAQEMVEFSGNEKYNTMSIDRHCDWCDYEPLCRATLQALDIEFIKKKEYAVNEKHEREEPDFEA